MRALASHSPKTDTSEIVKLETIGDPSRRRSVTLSAGGRWPCSQAVGDPVRRRSRGLVVS